MKNISDKYFSPKIVNILNTDVFKVHQVAEDIIDKQKNTSLLWGLAVWVAEDAFWRGWIWQGCFQEIVFFVDLDPFWQD